MVLLMHSCEESISSPFCGVRFCAGEVGGDWAAWGRGCIEWGRLGLILAWMQFPILSLRSLPGKGNKTVFPAARKIKETPEPPELGWMNVQDLWQRNRLPAYPLSSTRLGSRDAGRGEGEPHSRLPLSYLLEIHCGEERCGSEWKTVQFVCCFTAQV